LITNPAIRKEDFLDFFVLVSVNGVEAFVILESPTFRFHRLNYERRWWGRHTPGVRISKLSFDLRSDAGADVHHSQPDSE